MTPRCLITCEHGGNRIPPRYRELFKGHEALLASHRGHDPGALTVARDLATALNAPLFVATTSRLLIDLNRSIGHPRLYSEATRALPHRERQEILQRYYLPHRSKVEAAIAGLIAQGHRVVHIASHSFTPVLDGEVRNADIGLLYDPSRPGESALCRRWQQTLAAIARDIKVRRNYPYTGRSDGLTAHMRRRFPPEAYVGIELELNQRYPPRGGAHWRELRGLVLVSLQQALSCP